MDRESTNAEPTRNISSDNVREIEKKTYSKTPMKSSQTENNAKISDTDLVINDDDVDSSTDDIDMSAWDSLLVPVEIKRALREMKFCTPTEIQSKVRFRYIGYIIIFSLLTLLRVYHKIHNN